MISFHSLYDTDNAGNEEYKVSVKFLVSQEGLLHGVN